MRGRNVAACIISALNEKNGTKKEAKKREDKRKIKENQKDCGREGPRKEMREIL